MKQAYVQAMRLGRAVAGKTRVLAALERSSSPRVRWIRTLFGIYDSADLVHLDLPWWTYASIDAVENFLAGRVGRATRVFEYGAGASTVWLAKRCTSVHSTEHDRPFAEAMQALFSAHPNVAVAVVPDTQATGAPGEARSLRKGYQDRAFDDYVQSISKIDGEFDLVVIDGRARVACLAAALDRLSADGIVLFDNSDRAEYRAGIESSGLVETRLPGLAPALPLPSQTSLLAKRR